MDGTTMRMTANRTPKLLFRETLSMGMCDWACCRVAGISAVHSETLSGIHSYRAFFGIFQKPTAAAKPNRWLRKTVGFPAKKTAGEAFFLRIKAIPCHTYAMNKTIFTISDPLRRAAALWLALAAILPAAMIEGAKPKKWEPDPARHRIAIRREADNDKQAKLIAAAEAAPPTADALRKAIGDGPAPKDPSQWWYREELGIRIPFAVTVGAVDYYSDLVKKYRKETFERFTQPSSRLDYHATVAHHPNFEHDGKTFKNVHVVTLTLNFSENFAATATEGIQFEKQRTVVLDGNGKVVAIFGDGPTKAPVLAI